MKKFGTIGHTFSGDMAATMLMASALMMASHRAGRNRRVRTEQAGPKEDTRTERQRWNDEVEARKAAKKGAKP